MKYGDYAESLLKRKIAGGELATEKSQRTWSDAQDLHLLPSFEDWFIDAIKRRDVEEWKMRQGERVRRRLVSPVTVNGWLRVLLSTLRSAVADLELDHDPTVGVKPIDTSTWSTYTEEDPNSLTVAEVPEFMKHARELYPQHYAQLLLGLSTGRRPCELRPLRRCGASPDVRWDESVLLVRRSQVIGDPVERTKTKVRLRIALPPSLVEVLRWHVEEHLLAKKMRESELLFPSRTGGYQSPNVLAKPIVQIASAARIGKHLSPYFMRRTFQDLCRAAQVHDFVARSISGHATVEMHQHYSSVSSLEVRDGLAKVVSLVDFRQARDRVVAEESGDAGGDEAREALDRS
ncbi:MAG: site-specific integrase [Deltaproteobacteria bacterium]|nr:site-specific integrase [Kofleriaceae bacterium]